MQMFLTPKFTKSLPTQKVSLNKGVGWTNILVCRADIKGSPDLLRAYAIGT